MNWAALSGILPLVHVARMSVMQRSRAIAIEAQRALLGRFVLLSGLLLLPALLLLLISP